MSCLKDKLVKIRKPHKCWGCGMEFPVGCILNYNVSMFEGEFCTSYWCPICSRILADKKARDYFIDGDGGVSEFGIIQELHEFWLKTCRENTLFIMEKESWPKFY